MMQISGCELMFLEEGCVTDYLKRKPPKGPNKSNGVLFTASAASASSWFQLLRAKTTVVKYTESKCLQKMFTETER